jgi:hypothetical protein
MLRRTTIVTTFAAAVISLACTPTPYAIRGPDGHRWWVISCRHSQGSCWATAGQICPHGYDVGDESGRTTGAVAYSSGSLTAVRTTYRGELMVHCHYVNGPEP